MLTGDYPSHEIWRQSRENNLAYAAAGVNEIKSVFPDVKVFPSLGNHEAYPCNRYYHDKSILKNHFSQGIY